MSSSSSDDWENNSRKNDEAIVDALNSWSESSKHLLNYLQAQQHPLNTRAYIFRDRNAANIQLVKDYFDDEPTWGANVFRRRFRMTKQLFIRISNALEANDEYFQLRQDATGTNGFTPFQKCTVELRQLAYGGGADQYDEYLRVAQSTCTECLKKNCRSVIRIFGDEYLRKPTSDDCQRLLRMHKARHGFPGMLGSLDCMHWAWQNCPVAWKGQFTRGDQGCPTIILEAVASQDLWIWHAFFGVAGSNNDINVLNQSPLFSDTLQGKAPQITFDANGQQYNQGYYLVDGIYPEWPTFVKSIQCPTDEKRLKFKTMQEVARKDVERAFGVLQKRWAIVRGPCRLWFREHIKDIILACVILHNMIVEDEKENITNWVDDDNDGGSSSTPTPTPIQGATPSFRAYMERSATLRDKQKHAKLQNDLIEHIWQHFGTND